MSAWKMSLTCLILLALTASARAQRPSEEKLREEAHKTVLRRLSKSHDAETKGIGLSAQGADLIDLYLDLARNESDFMRGRVPPSRHFHGPAHGAMKVEGGKLTYSACFVQLVIDRVEVSLTEVPAIVRTCLDKKAFAKAAIRRDGTAIQGWRLNFLAFLVTATDPALASTRGWPELRREVADILLAALPGKGTFEIMTALKCLQTVGDDRVAKVMIEKAERLLQEGVKERAFPIYRAVFSMRVPAARQKAREALHGDDADLAVIAMYAVGSEPDEETWKYMKEVLADDSEASIELKRAAIHGFEHQRTEEAQAVLLRLFQKTEDDDQRYSIACSLTRCGSDKAIPYLRKKLEEFQKSGRLQDTVRAHVLKNLLKEHDHGGPSDADER